jgi:hypothetical protein
MNLSALKLVRDLKGIESNLLGASRYLRRCGAEAFCCRLVPRRCQAKAFCCQPVPPKVRSRSFLPPVGTSKVPGRTFLLPAGTSMGTKPKLFAASRQFKGAEPRINFRNERNKDVACGAARPRRDGLDNGIHFMTTQSLKSRATCGEYFDWLSTSIIEPNAHYKAINRFDRFTLSEIK